MSALVDLRAGVRARELVDAEVARLVAEALAEGESRSAVASILGISRATLYRSVAAGEYGPAA